MQRPVQLRALEVEVEAEEEAEGVEAEEDLPERAPRLPRTCLGLTKAAPSPA